MARPAVLLAALAAAEPNHTLGYLPFSWDTLPRYTFCVNSTGMFDNSTVSQFEDAALAYVAAQDVFVQSTVIDRPAGSFAWLEYLAPPQAAALKAVNPRIQTWFYYVPSQRNFSLDARRGMAPQAIDMLRIHDFENDHTLFYQHPECLLHDVEGVPVPRSVWDFGQECGQEAWLNTSRAIIAEGGLDGIFIDGFQGCDPFVNDGCSRVCTSVNSTCDPDVMVAWNEGLKNAMWRLKNEILGANKTLTCNYTPGPFVHSGVVVPPRRASRDVAPQVCDPSQPISECPCDATNDERGGGNFDNMQIVVEVEETQDDYAMLTHVPHGDEDDSLMQSIARFLVGSSVYQYHSVSDSCFFFRKFKSIRYHGSGFGYECATDGWIDRSDTVEHAYTAPLGAPVTDAVQSPGCADDDGTWCVRTRSFAAGTKVYVNYSNSAACIVWADGTNDTLNDGCNESSAWSY